MEPSNTNYFTELSLRLQREQIECAALEDDRLPVLLNGREIGVVTLGGGMRVRKESLDDPKASGLYHKAGSIAAEVHEYMELMENAPPLKAQSLDAPYKLLADFNGYVLGGMESKYGVQFTTWQWAYEKTGLNCGHYCGNDYAAAKQDFALRSGLIQEQKQFTPEQLTALYLCTSDALNYGLDISYEQDQLIRSAQSVIEEAVPDLMERTQQALQEQQEFTQEQTM